MEFKTIDMESFCSEKNIKLVYFRSGTYGHIFKAFDKDNGNLKYGIKMIPNPEGVISTEIENPTNYATVEMRATKLLGDFDSDYFVKPIDIFYCDIDPFIYLDPNYIVLREINTYYDKFLKIYYPRPTSIDSEEQYNPDEKLEIPIIDPKYKKVAIIAYPWNQDDLLSFIKKNHPHLVVNDYANIFFQILSALAIVQKKYPAFRHNSFKANDIFVNYSEDGNPKEYELNGSTYKFPRCLVQIKLWDFSFVSIKDLIENDKVNAEWSSKIGINNSQNRYHDMHYFFSTLARPGFLKYFNQIMPAEILEFVNRIIPEEFRYYDFDGKYNPNITRRGRLLVNSEYTTPLNVLKTDPLFQKYKVE